MRVSTTPGDASYIDDRPRRAWCNDVLIEGWTVADEFRRVVITSDKVYHGSVLVERLPTDKKEVPVVIEPQAPSSVGFVGLGMVKDESSMAKPTPAIMPTAAPTPAPTAAPLEQPASVAAPAVYSVPMRYRPAASIDKLFE